MKKTMKKMLALVMVLMMVASVAMPVFAEEVAPKCPGATLADPTTAQHMKSNCDYEFVVKHEPGCSEQGYSVYKCLGCDKYFADDIVDALDGTHNYVGTEATCTTAGDLKCTICGHESKPAAPGHDWGDWDTNATCGVEGAQATRTCKVCGEKETKDLDGDHTWNTVPEILKAPVCNADLEADDEDSQGLAKYTCSACGATKEIVIYALDHHKDIEYVEIKTATCAGGGVQLLAGATAVTIDNKQYAQKCSCGWKNYEEIGATHSWGNTPSFTIPVGCNTWGFVYYACINCGAVDAREKYEPAGHNMVVVSGGNATCGSAVTQVLECQWDKYVCEDEDCIAAGHKAHPTTDTCNHTETKNLQALEHNWVSKSQDATCVTPAMTYEWCSVCESIQNKVTTGSASPNAHVWVKDLANSTEPTCYNLGMYTYYCTVEGCNGAKQEPVAQLEHDYDADGDGDVDTDDAVYSAPLCGKDGFYTYSCQHDNCANTKVMPGEFFEPSNPNHHDAAARTHILKNQAGEPVANRDPACGISEIRTYRCETCTAANATGSWITYAIIGETPDHNLDPTKTIAADLPEFCGDTGHTAGWKCLDCGAEQVSVALKTSTTNHNLVITSEAKKVTCVDSVTKACDATFNIVDDKGNVYNSTPVQCNHTETENATGHDNVVTGRDNNCDDFGFETYMCKVCGEGHIEKYEYATGHNLVEDKTAYVAPDCNTKGQSGEKCTNVHTNRVLGATGTVACTYAPVTPIDKLGHLDKDGNVVICVMEDFHCYREGCCTATGECTDCVEFEESHDFVTTKVSATCQHYEYELHVCTICEYDYVENTGFELGSHNLTGAYKKVKVDGVWVEDKTQPQLAKWYDVKPATYAEAGLKGFDCKNANCDHTELLEYTLKDVKFTLDTDSGIKAGADIVNSGTLVVTVKASAFKVDLYSIDLDFKYNKNVLTLVSSEISAEAKALVGESGIAIVGTATAGEIGIYMANSGATPVDTTLNGVDVPLVTFVFSVKADINDATTGTTSTDVSITAGSILKADVNDKVEANIDDAKETVTIQTLGNVTMGTIESSEKRVDDYDARALVEIMMDPEAEYLATADINKDGVINSIDYMALAKYVANGSDYKGLCATK